MTAIKIENNVITANNELIINGVNKRTNECSF